MTPRSEITLRHWKRVEYERLLADGFFRAGDPIELLGGQLIVAEPQGSRHFAAVRAAEEALRAAFGPDWEVRGQGRSRSTRNPSPSRIWPWCRAAFATTRPRTRHVRCSSSRWPNRACSSIASTRAVSTRG